VVGSIFVLLKQFAGLALGDVLGREFGLVHLGRGHGGHDAGLAFAVAILMMTAVMLVMFVAAACEHVPNKIPGFSPNSVGETGFVHGRNAGEKEVL
jgi:hypothetical protein